MYNKVIMVGNLTRNIELRYLPSGAGIAKSAIASSYKYKTQTGEQKEEVCFLDFNIFGRSAEVANQYLRKGSKVLLEGRLVLEQWTAQDGTNRSKHSLRVDTMKMLDSKNSNPQQQGGNNYYNPNQENNQYEYQQQQNQHNNMNSDASQGNYYNINNQSQRQSVPAPNVPEIDISNEDIPF